MNVKWHMKYFLRHVHSGWMWSDIWNICIHIHFIFHLSLHIHSEWMWRDIGNISYIALHSVFTGWLESTNDQFPTPVASYLLDFTYTVQYMKYFIHHFTFRSLCTSSDVYATWRGYISCWARRKLPNEFSSNVPQRIYGNLKRLAGFHMIANDRKRPQRELFPYNRRRSQTITEPTVAIHFV